MEPLTAFLILIWISVRALSAQAITWAIPKDFIIRWNKQELFDSLRDFEEDIGYLRNLVDELR